MQPLPFLANVKNKIITGGITDAKGNFNIPVVTGVYDITIEYISFKTITVPDKKISKNESLGSYSLEINAELLGEIEIIAERTTV